MAVFVATVETGSMAAAARALELNAALVGRQIQWLEDGLGVRLFELVGLEKDDPALVPRGGARCRRE